MSTAACRAAPPRHCPHEIPYAYQSKSLAEIHLYTRCAKAFQPRKSDSIQLIIKTNIAIVQSKEIMNIKPVKMLQVKKNRPRI